MSENQPHILIDWETMRARLGEIVLESEREMSPEMERQILTARALELALVKTDQHRAEAEIEVLEFRLENRRYAIETNQVQEIVPFQGITPLPGLPHPFCGVINLRSTVLPVIDLGYCFGLSLRPPRPHQVVLVLGESRPDLGALVDESVGVCTLALESLAEPQAGAPETKNLRGICQDGLIVIEGAALLQDERFWVEQ